MTELSQNISPIAIIRAAITMRLIDNKQKEVLLEEWCRFPNIDMFERMESYGFLTHQQVETLIDLIQNGLFSNIDSHNSSTGASEVSSFLTDSGGSSAFVFPKSSDDSDSVDGAESGDFSSFELRTKIGAGGLGVVNLYKDITLNRDVAVKEIRREALTQEDKRQLVRFIQEAQITGQLQHPAIVPIYEMSIKPNGRPYFVMKHVQGTSMEDALKKCQHLPTEEERFEARMKLLEPLISVCEAVAYAHEKGVIHRDLKPANIILGKFGETVILDWGLAKFVGQDDNSEFYAKRDVMKTVALRPLSAKDAELTQADELVGTPAYMAPEQVDENYGEVDQRSDVYALGVIFFRILTGRMPYVAENISSLLDLIAQVGVPAPDPAVYYSAIPKELSAICRKAMAKNKRNRFENALELAHVLEAFRDGRTVNVYEYSPGEVIKRYYRKYKITMIVSVLLIIVVFVSLFSIAHYAYLSNMSEQVASDAAKNASDEKLKYEAAQREIIDTKLRSLQHMAEIPSLADEGLQSVEDLSNFVQKEFDRCTKENLESINAFAADHSIDDLENFAYLREKSSDMLTSYPFFLSCSFISEDNKLLGTFPESKEQQFKLDVFPVLDKQMSMCRDNGQPIMSRMKPNQTFIYYLAPIKPDTNRCVGFVVLTLNPEKMLQTWVENYYKNDSFYIWVMQDDGLILSDIHPEDIRTNVYYDARYTEFPDLIRMAKRFPITPFGIGHYSYNKSFENNYSVTHKVCAWKTLQLTDNVKWSLIATASVEEDF